MSKSVEPNKYVLRTSEGLRDLLPSTSDNGHMDNDAVKFRTAEATESRVRKVAGKHHKIKTTS